nr:retinol dehydrogenase 7-like [Biomphalaria glabrata]
MTDLWYVLLLLVITLFLIEYLRRRLTVGGYRDKYVLVTGCDSGFGQRLATGDYFGWAWCLVVKYGVVSCGKVWRGV